MAARLLLAALVALAALAAATPADVQGVRLWAAPDSTRVVLDLSRSVEYSLFTLSGPERVVIDLQHSRAEATLDLPIGDGYVQRIRSAGKPDGSLRVVLDLTERVQPKSFTVEPNEVYGHRLVIDLGARRDESDSRPEKRLPSAERDVVIAIDPGHGGEDPGAIGRRGTREKDVVLAIARQLAADIEREPGMRAVLTRNGDYYLPHRERIEFARAERADLFISIHADAFKDRRAHGSSVYILSQRGATDEAARWLAEKANAADLVGGVALSDKDDVLASVLLDLSQTAAISASSTAAERVLERLGRVGNVRRDTVQQANFLVLKSPDIPSILVETAFISNPDEETRLRDPGFQALIANAMMSGVRDYFADHAPPGTRIASGELPPPGEPIRHVIGHGDTLSGIAVQYNVSVRSLKSVNGLRGDRILIGQVLQIPTS